MKSKREYKSGTIWGAWLWTYTDTGYLTRLHLVKTPWGALCVHWINGPDPEPFRHDHPVSFLSIVLKGWYIESRHRPGEDDPFRMVKWFNFFKASEDDNHTIRQVSPGGCITLAFMGPKTRDWGFHTDGGWSMWKTYYKWKKFYKRKDESPNN